MLREALRGVLPEAIRTRKSKIGFQSPLPEWFQGPMRGWVLEQVNHPDFLGSDLWNGPVIRDYVMEQDRTQGWDAFNSERLWPFLHAHHWRRNFCRAAS